MAISITCQAFRHDDDIPVDFTCEGDDRSPALSWQGVPAGANTIAVIMDDPDAPKPGFTHWVLFNLPASATDLPEGLPKGERLANGGIQGTNDFGDVGYGGPCPPPGPAHRYSFRVYALDTGLDLPPRATKREVVDKIRGHVLAEGELVGLYQRQRVTSRLV